MIRCTNQKTVNDLSDPRIAKTYSGSLIRAGEIKTNVHYVLNGSNDKLLLPTKNCHIVFVLENLKLPQPSAPASVVSRGQAKPAEPYDDLFIQETFMSKYIERTVDICKGITNGGVIIGEMYIGGCAQKRDSSLEMFGTGLA